MGENMLIKYAPDAFKLLRGIFCIYKPAEVSIQGVKNRVAGMICRDLNMMECRPPENYVEIHEDPTTETGLSITNVPSVSDTPLVCGPRYQMQDFKLHSACHMGFYTSGLCVVGLKCFKTIKELKEARHLKTYQLCGKLGRSTDTFHHSGRIVEKSTFGHVSKYRMDRIIASIQAAHQRSMFHYMGVDIKSQTAYEIASKGLVRPASDSTPLIYGIKCIHFASPDFTIEVQCINETEDYLLELVNTIGLNLKTNACCTKIRQTRFGHYTLEHALLRKHWTPEHIINNMTMCNNVVNFKEITPTTPNITENPLGSQDIEAYTSVI